MGETIYIEEGNVHVCNNCGAFAEEANKIKHCTTCKKGESKKWEKIYSKK